MKIWKARLRLTCCIVCGIFVPVSHSVHFCSIYSTQDGMETMRISHTLPAAVLQIHSGTVEYPSCNERLFKGPSKNMTEWCEQAKSETCPLQVAKSLQFCVSWNIRLFPFHYTHYTSWRQPLNAPPSMLWTKMHHQRSLLGGGFVDQNPFRRPKRLPFSAWVGHGALICKVTAPDVATRQAPNPPEAETDVPALEKTPKDSQQNKGFIGTKKCILLERVPFFSKTKDSMMLKFFKLATVGNCAMWRYILPVETMGILRS